MPAHRPRSSVAVAVAITLALAVVTVGCKGRNRSGPATKTSAAPVEPTPRDRACDSLDRAECLRALHCTLHHVANAKYDCRPAAGPCEANMMQSDRRECETRAGCVWDPGGCYCPFPGYGSTKVPDKGPPGGACACGGGAPARCRSAKDADGGAPATP